MQSGQRVTVFDWNEDNASGQYSVGYFHLVNTLTE